MKILKFELKRMYRSHILQLSMILLVMIGILGVVLYNIYYRDIENSRYLLLSLYNSFTQFTYLVLAFIFVLVFCKDFQNGVYAWYKQLGISGKKVIIMKFVSLLITVLPIVNISLIIAQICIGNADIRYFVSIILFTNLNLIYTISLALFLSVMLKKVIVSTLVMYGMYIVSNGLNLCLFGLCNPADSNSATSYYLAKMLNPLQIHYSLNKIDISSSLLFFIAIAIPLIWILAFIVSSIYIKKYK